MSRAADQIGRGHAIEAHRFHSTLILLRVWFALTLLGFMAGIALSFVTTHEADRQLAVSHMRAEVAQRLDPATLLGTRQQPTVIMAEDPLARIAATKLLWRSGIAGTMLALLLGTGLTMLLRHHWIATAREAALDQVLRGNRLATQDELAALVNRSGLHGTPLTIGGVPLPREDEARHLLAIGKTGSGKTTFLHAHLAQVEARGEHALIFDPDGSYTEHFYSPERGDVLLDPFDARSARWNPLTDIASLADAHRIASVLLPKPTGTGDNGFWFDQARTLLAHILDHCARTGTTELVDLAAMLNTATSDSLRAITTGTPAARIFESGGERATASVLFMMTRAASSVTMLAAVPDTAPTFSFDHFYASLAEHDGPKPFIFLAAPRRYREAASPVLAAWIDGAASAILQRPIDDAPNAWLFIDELPSLPPIQSLLTLLPEGRKHRACIVIAFQSIAQLRQTYSDHGAEIVTGQTATQLVMAAGDHASAKWAVDLMGTIEVESQRPSDQLSEDRKTHGSLSTTRERKALVLDAEVTGLRIGEAFLRLSSYPIAKVTIDPPAARPAIAPAFVPAPTPPPIATGPATPPPTRIEDRDDWLSMEGPF